MSFRTKRVLIWSPIYALISYFLLTYLSSFFGEVNRPLIAVIALMLLFIQTVPMLFEERGSSVIGRFFSTIFGIWQWFFFMFLLVSIVLYVISFFIRVPSTIIVVILLLISGIGFYAYIHARHLVVKEKILEFDDINREYNIVQLSDIHFGSIRHKKYIKELALKLDELSETCDLAIISGDLADGSCFVEEDDFLELENVNIPIIFTSGNHDYYPGIENVHNACRRAGIIVLENSGMQYENLNIYGLSYSFDDISMPGRGELENFIDEGMINIVNYHVPNGWNELSGIGFNIQLSGHTHGGQFYPAIWFGNLLYEGHNMGLFRDEFDHYLHVTTGVGCMDFPMRWGTDSELVILKLRKC